VITLVALIAAPNLINEGMCAGREPRAVTLTEISESGRKLEGECVRVTGGFLAGALVAVGEIQPDGYPRVRLGLYSHEPRDALNSIVAEGGKQWEVTGVVDTCARIGEQVRAEHAERDAAAIAAGTIRPAPVMLAGFCHYADAPVIWVASARRVPTSP
jgi:hypothetical protein